MDATLVSLLAANIAFVGGHFALSHPFRAPLVKKVGEAGFLGMYSLVSFATFAWIILAFKAVGPGGAALWNGQSNTMWTIASLLTIIALVLLTGSVKGNPALPQTGADAVAKAEAQGVFAVTRHPMMWGIAIWALSHILVSPSGRTIITAGAMGVLGLVGSHLQDRKKEALIGASWQSWEAKTSYWPRLFGLGRISVGLWLSAIAGWLVITWLHIWLAEVPAGVWRWVG